MARARWSDTESVMLTRLRAEGLTLAEIGRRMARSRPTIRLWIGRLGLAAELPGERPRRRAPSHNVAAHSPKERRPAVLPVAASDFIKPPTRAQLMAGR